MAANSAQLVALGAAAVIGYLTWSTVQTPGTFTEQEPGAVKIAVAKHSTSPPVLDEKTRDPFVRPGELETWGNGSGGAGGESAAPLHLAGIVLSGEVRYAYVNGIRLRVGDEYRGYRLVRIAQSHVEMTNGSERFNLWLNAAAPAGAKAAAASPTAARSYIKIINESRPPARAPIDGREAPPSVIISTTAPASAAAPAGDRALGEAETAVPEVDARTVPAVNGSVEADEPSAVGR